MGGSKPGDKPTNDIDGALGDMTSIFDTIPPGADEVIALSRVIDIVRKVSERDEDEHTRDESREISTDIIEMASSTNKLIN